MPSGTLIICSTAAYAAAFVLELMGLKRRLAWQRASLIGLTFIALVLHFIYLVQTSKGLAAIPFSAADWFLWAAWLLATIYFAALFYLPRSPNGIVLLPIVIALILSSHWASNEPLGSEQSLRIWALIHSLVLLIGTVTVCIGFLAGLMYLLQSYALKHSHSPVNRLRLPSLEWLERVNSRSLGLSAVLIALGFASGLIMRNVTHRGETQYSLWVDPVVLSLAAMLLWLVAAEVFRFVYPAARRGRKVAYLTLASFVFLIIVLASLTLLDTMHGAPRRNADQQPRHPLANPQSERSSLAAVGNPKSNVTRVARLAP
jgi:ABC-type uncharacterized transport system permease subunit